MPIPNSIIINHTLSHWSVLPNGPPRVPCHRSILFGSGGALVHQVHLYTQHNVLSSAHCDYAVKMSPVNFNGILFNRC